MKMQSKAEEALHKQVKWLRQQMTLIEDEVIKLNSRKEGFFISLNSIEDEISRLEQTRLKASQSRKPVGT